MVSGGRGIFAGERGGGRVPIPMRGHTLWYSLYIRMYFVVASKATLWGRHPILKTKSPRKRISYFRIPTKPPKLKTFKALYLE
jgi:hypothetical protein